MLKEGHLFSQAMLMLDDCTLSFDLATTLMLVHVAQLTPQAILQTT